VSTSIGTPIDRASGRGFGVTGRGGTGGSLAMDKGRGWAEVVLVGMEGTERDID